MCRPAQRGSHACRCSSATTPPVARPAGPVATRVAAPSPPWVGAETAILAAYWARARGGVPPHAGRPAQQRGAGPGRGGRRAAGRRPGGRRRRGRETDWRRGYLRHFRALVEAGLPSDDARRTTSRPPAWPRCSPGCGCTADGADIAWPRRSRACRTGRWRRPRSPVPASRERELTLPYRGELLRGDACSAGWTLWVARRDDRADRAPRRSARSPRTRTGSTCPTSAWSCSAPAPRWVRCRPLLGWGGTVVGVDLPRPELWQRVRGRPRRRRHA